MSPRGRFDASTQAIASLCQQAQAERTALLMQAQPAQERLAQGARTVGTLLRALALVAAVAGGVGLLKHWLRPVSDRALFKPSDSARLLHWMRLGTAAVGTARLLAARLQR